jgi:hypothetical protein
MKLISRKKRRERLINLLNMNKKNYPITKNEIENENEKVNII